MPHAGPNACAFKPEGPDSSEDRIVAEFDTYEEATEHSDDPMTSECSGKMGALVDGPPTSHNLDAGVWEV